ncbi:hypothetical protein [Plastoroseomonas arctica]|uniref:Uncharacterized protein n=1 Tax=Plastoroseomonas arctica TaxID=1509237 RepID=A0AAF1JV24_9PROT|nr:hypothetical protein [Plastoroseomonas arctica]MBR0654301.1 hypothetical protein [Plastoroseomonas arctica]
MGVMTVTLAMAPGPGFPEGSPAHRYILALALDGDGRPDAPAWIADEEPWPAMRIRPGETDIRGDVQYDEDSGWSLRFFNQADDRSDAPATGLTVHETLRPGAYVTVNEPEGEARSFRVVGVEAV